MDKTEAIIGIDIGGTNCVLAFTGKNGEYFIEDTIKTNPLEKIDRFIPRLFNKISEMHSKVENIEISSIGIAAPCGNFYNGIIDNPSNINWGKADIVTPVTEHFHVPTVLTNDANAAAIGEMVYGNAIGLENFILLTLGTGLGCGIVSDGKLLHGANGFAGEIGHIIVSPNGRQCSCGKSGCLETYISANGLRRTVASLLCTKQNNSKLKEISFKDMTGKLISELANKGDEIAIETFKIAGEFLGRAIANFVNMLDPQKILLFGGLAEAGELLLQHTRKHFTENVIYLNKNKAEIDIAKLQKGKAAVLGVSYMAMKNNNHTIAI